MWNAFVLMTFIAYARQLRQHGCKLINSSSSSPMTGDLKVASKGVKSLNTVDYSFGDVRGTSSNMSEIEVCMRHICKYSRAGVMIV